MNEHDRRRLADLERLAEHDRVRGDASAQIVGRATTQAAQSIANATTTIVNYDIVGTDTHSAITSGATWKFTAPHTAHYAIAASLALVPSATWATGESCLLTVFRSGVIFTYLDFRDMYGGAVAMAMRVGGMTTVPMTAGQYLDIRVNQTSGGALAMISSVLQNHVAIWRV